MHDLRRVLYHHIQRLSLARIQTGPVLLTVWQSAVHVLSSLGGNGMSKFMATARKKRGTVRAARLDIRLNPRAKEKIEQAAVVSHQSLTDFVVTNLLRASEE